MELSANKRPLEGEEGQDEMRKLSKLADATEKANNSGHKSDLSDLFPNLNRDLSVRCLVRCSRSGYGSIAQINHRFHDLVHSDELYKLRREAGIVEYWVYYSCSLLEWEAFDPKRNRWMCIPRMPPNECFMCSDKESLAVGTELLVFGKEIMSPVIYRYSIITNDWTSGMKMNTPRCLFGSASLQEFAILAGGCDPLGNILGAAELYNSLTRTWETLPSLNTPRKMCSGFFMDGKFYIIGGVGVGLRRLTCGEEFDLNTRTWRLIPDMFPRPDDGAGANRVSAASSAPPLVAVVNNVLYAAHYTEMVVRRYDKADNSWVTIGGLPERVGSMNGWGLAFRACGDLLIVIGGLDGRAIEVNACVPSEGALKWKVCARRRTGSFVYNCAVMGC